MRRASAVGTVLGVAATGLAFMAPPAAAAPIAFSVQSDGDDQLYSIDLATGVATAIGPTGFVDVECLTFSADGTLYGVDDGSEQLLTFDVGTGAGTVVGSLGLGGSGFVDCGLSFDAAGDLFMSTDVPGTLFQLDPATGAATAVGAQGQEVTGLAADCTTMFGLGGDDTNNLVTIDTTTGAATPVGPLVNVSVSDGGVDFDGSQGGTLWGINDGGGPGGASQVFTVDTTTGTATLVSDVSVGGTPTDGYEGLAIAGIDCAAPPPPPPPPPAPAPVLVITPRFAG